MANALDLTDRLLPRLQSHVKLEPTLVHFPPFSRQEIATIITNRLEQGGAGLVIDPMAVQYCSRKVAAMRGDLRNALDICRLVVRAMVVMEMVVMVMVVVEMVVMVKSVLSPLHYNQRGLPNIVGHLTG